MQEGLRRIAGLTGQVELELEYAPRTEYSHIGLVNAASAISAAESRQKAASAGFY
jgi:hypothetical protein